MSKVTTIIDNRKNRIISELSSKGVSKEKRTELKKQLKQLKYDEFMG
jgi:hypothetical protein